MGVNQTGGGFLPLSTIECIRIWAVWQTTLETMSGWRKWCRGFDHHSPLDSGGSFVNVWLDNMVARVKMVPTDGTFSTARQGVDLPQGDIISPKASSQWRLMVLYPPTNVKIRRLRLG